MKKKNCSIKDVAEYVGVATSTVSRVLNDRDANIHTSEDTRKRILDAAKFLNYIPNINAKRLYSRKSEVIALVIPSHERHKKNIFSDHHLSEIFSGIESGLTNTNYRLLIIFNDQRFVEKKEYLSLFRQRAIDGMLIWGDYDEHVFWQDLVKSNDPFMFICEPSIPFANYNYIIHDYVQAGQLALEYLKGKGHTNIGWVGAGIKNGITADIETGFSLVKDPPKLISYYGDFSKACGKSLLPQILVENPEISAILTANIQVAEGVEFALKELNRDIDVVVCDYAPDESTCTYPRICVSDYLLGKRAVTQLVELIEGAKERVQETLPVKLLLERTNIVSSENFSKNM